MIRRAHHAQHCAGHIAVEQGMGRIRAGFKVKLIKKSGAHHAWLHDADVAIGIGHLMGK